MMEPRYLWVLDYAWGDIMCIKLTDAELEESKNYDDFESFISECLKDKYNFRLKDCCWMISESHEFKKHGF